MVNKIGKITIFVNNQEEAKVFWTDKMNFVVKAEIPMGPNFKWLEVGPSEDEFTTFVIYEKELMLSHNPSANVSHPNVILSTTDMDTTYEELKKSGVEVGEKMVMPYGSMFKFKDQDGNEYLIREDK